MARKTKQEDAGFCVWIGPGIRGVISHGQIFPVPREKVRDTLPKRIAVLWDEGAGALIVGPNELAAARLAVKKEGSALYKIARKVAVLASAKE